MSEHFSLRGLLRPNILKLEPYRCARDDYNTGILLDANENAFGSPITSSDLPLHRYPSPTHPSLKSIIASLRTPASFTEANVFLGVGSDEIIDLLQRICLTPGIDKILITPPTYGMYAVCAQVNDVGVVKVPLRLDSADGEGGESGRFSLRVDEIKKVVASDPTIKLIFLCSPGNPTGTLLSLSSIRSLLSFPAYKGLVVVDEAYIDFTSDPFDKSAVSLVEKFENLVVMQTLSKGFGLAGIRLGIAVSQPPLLSYLTSTKAPYNISLLTAHTAHLALSNFDSLRRVKANIATLVMERGKLIKALHDLRNDGLGVGEIIGANDANFVLVQILSESTTNTSLSPSNPRAHRVYKTLAETYDVVVRYRGGEMGCEGCLRITIGTPDENQKVIEIMQKVLREV